MGLSLLSSNESEMDWSMKNEDRAVEKWIAKEDRGRSTWRGGGC